MDNKSNLKESIMDMERGYIPAPRQLLLTLGANATILLAELCDRYDYYTNNDLLNEFGEFYYTIENITRNTGLSRKQQDTSIVKLKEYKIILSVIQRGIPQKRYFKINENTSDILEDLNTESSSIESNIKEKSKKSIDRFNESKNG